MTRPELAARELDLVARSLKMSGIVFPTHPEAAAVAALGKATVRASLAYQFISGMREQPPGYGPLNLSAIDSEWRRGLADVGLDEETAAFYCQLEQKAPILPLVASLRQSSGFFCAGEEVYVVTRHRQEVTIDRGRLCSPVNEELMTDGSNWRLVTAAGVELAVTGRLVFKPWELHCLKSPVEVWADRPGWDDYPVRELMRAAAAQVELRRRHDQ